MLSSLESKKSELYNRNERSSARIKYYGHRCHMQIVSFAEVMGLCEQIANDSLL